MDLISIANALAKDLPWLAFGKPASEALTRLVRGTTALPEAYIDRYVQKIKDETDAESLVRNAVAQAAAKKLVEKQDVVDRSVDYFTRKVIQKQINREAVAEKTIENLRENPPDSDQHFVSDDFMNFFEEFAEKATSEGLRDIFSRILAGEIRKPKTFSLRTLSFVSTMDNAIANNIQIARNYISNSFIIKIEPFNSSPGLDFIHSLSDIGLLHSSVGLSNNIMTKDGYAKLLFKNRAIIIQCDEEKVNVPAILQTITGTEVFSLVDPVDDMDFISSAAKTIKSVNKKYVVQIGDFARNGDEILVNNLSEVS